MRILFLCLSLSALAACTSQVQSAADALPSVPPMTHSADSVRNAVAKASYSVSHVGFARTWFGKDTLTWESQMEDTTTFLRNQIAQFKKLRFHFQNDTAVTFTPNGKTTAGSYSVGYDSTDRFVGLKITYLSSEFNFDGSGKPQPITVTYKVSGFENDRLYLESPNEVNNQRVMLMMKKN